MHSIGFDGFKARAALLISFRSRVMCDGIWRLSQYSIRRNRVQLWSGAPCCDRCHCAHRLRHRCRGPESLPAHPARGREGVTDFSVAVTIALIVLDHNNLTLMQIARHLRSYTELPPIDLTVVGMPRPREERLYAETEASPVPKRPSQTANTPLRDAMTTLQFWPCR
jgi:hypothetical protein